MKSLLPILVLFCAFSFNSCKQQKKDQNNLSVVPEKKKSSYKVGDIPDLIGILDNSSDSIVIFETYKDTNIEKIVHSRDSVGKYFYYLGNKCMQRDSFFDAAVYFGNSASFGYLVDVSYSAVATCYYYDKKYDSSWVYVNKSLAINPNEQGALIIKELLEDKGK